MSCLSLSHSFSDRADGDGNSAQVGRPALGGGAAGGQMIAAMSNFFVCVHFFSQSIAVWWAGGILLWVDFLLLAVGKFKIGDYQGKSE